MIHLKNRSVFSLTGPDARTFVQGIITNDIYKLEKGPIYTFLLNPQGKYLYDFFFVLYDNQILLDYEEQNKIDIIQLLKGYKVGLKVFLKPTKYKVYSSWEDINSDISFRDPRSSEMGYRVFTLQDLISSDDFSRYEVQRVKNVIPDGTKDLIPKRSFPFEGDITYAIDEKKGCYIGQEVVARTISRGVIRKKLFFVKCDEGNTLPQIGTEILDQKNKKIGEMRSSVKNIGLALIRIEDAERKIFSQGIEIKIPKDMRE